MVKRASNRERILRRAYEAAIAAREKTAGEAGEKAAPATGKTATEAGEKAAPAAGKRKKRQPPPPKRMKFVWKVFNGNFKEVACFLYPDKAKAEATAVQLARKTGKEHFVNSVKVPMGADE